MNLLNGLKRFRSRRSSTTESGVDDIELEPVQGWARRSNQRSSSPIESDIGDIELRPTRRLAPSSNEPFSAPAAGLSSAGDKPISAPSAFSKEEVGNSFMPETDSLHLRNSNMEPALGALSGSTSNQNQMRTLIQSAHAPMQNAQVARSSSAIVISSESDQSDSARRRVVVVSSESEQSDSPRPRVVVISSESDQSDSSSLSDYAPPSFVRDKSTPVPSAFDLAGGKQALGEISEGSSAALDRRTDRGNNPSEVTIPRGDAATTTGDEYDYDADYEDELTPDQTKATNGIEARAIQQSTAHSNEPFSAYATGPSSAGGKSIPAQTKNSNNSREVTTPHVVAANTPTDEYNYDEAYPDEYSAEFLKALNEYEAQHYQQARSNEPSTTADEDDEYDVAEFTAEEWESAEKHQVQHLRQTATRSNEPPTMADEDDEYDVAEFTAEEWESAEKHQAQHLRQTAIRSNEPFSLSAAGDKSIPALNPFNNLSIEDTPLPGTSGGRDKGKQRLEEPGHDPQNKISSARIDKRGASVDPVLQGQRQSVSDKIRRAFAKLSVKDFPLAGTYRGGNQERERLEKLGHDVQGKWIDGKFIPKTDSAHLVDRVVAIPYPHLRDSESEMRRAYDVGIAYIEESSLHRRHVGSYFDEKEEGFNKDEHAWETPADYRKHARLVLRDKDAKDADTNLPTNLSNTVQLNLIDFAYVQASNTNEAAPFGLYKNKSEIDAANKSFEHTIKVNPPVYFVGDKQKKPTVTSLQNVRVISQDFSRPAQAELILARQILTELSFPKPEELNQRVAKVAKDYLSPDEYSEKENRWKSTEEEDSKIISYDNRCRTRGDRGR